MKKRVVMILAVALCLLCMTWYVKAEQIGGNCGEGVTWKYDAESTTLTISGSGRIADYYSSSALVEMLVPWHNLKDEITTVIVEPGVTYLGAGTLHNMEVLETVIIADTVTELAEYQFLNCVALKEISIPGNITTIPNGAFKGCFSLEKADLPQTVTEIGFEAFHSCVALKDINMPSNLKIIRAEAFYLCRELENLVFPDGMQEMHQDAFRGCWKLFSVTLPGSMTLLAMDAFSSCDRLRVLVFKGSAPENYGRIVSNSISVGYYPADDESWTAQAQSMIGCMEWVAVEDIAAFVPPTKNDPVQGSCGDNTTYRLENGVLTISGKGAVRSTPWAGYAEQITKVNISDDVTSFWIGAFANCVNLKQIKLPSKLTVITNEMFQNSGITSITIPNGVTQIGSYAFKNCDGLKRLVIPATVTSVGACVVSDCDNLTEVVFLGLPPKFPTGTGLYNKVFDGYEGCVFISKWNSWAFEDKINSGGKVTWVAGEGGTSGKCGIDATWKVEGDTLIISGVGKIRNYTGSLSAPWTHYMHTVKKVIVNDGITEIGNDAFYGMVALEEAEFADSVTVFGNDTFRFCTSLQSVKLSRNLKNIGEFSFLNCESLEYIILPDSLEEIAYEGFAGCKKLTQIVIPRNVKSVGQSVFMDCEKLQLIHFAGDVPEFNQFTFDELEATATYPWLNTTWTSEVLKNYGGEITWQHRECKGEHTFWEWERISEPTTQSTGLDKRVCSNCGFVEEKVLPQISVPSSSTTTTPTPPVTQPSIPADEGKVTVQPRLFSDEAILVCGLIAAVFVVCSVVIFIRIAVLTQRAKKEKDDET